ncbi:fibropellin-3-like isoform X2 [Lingula anatina]|uniref:Fibropellin-3-like isoform X2 n=1 Tax=Lingula anatina TaxID=7574 RepID=A0A1S3J6R5_LINAN|nr:fibropellin-3-like isoform X2 [Lingula anatina]|eukprot:XP_013406107.1 fibropellin-3-like isoform X2 [Lingula anatina]
MDLAPEETTSVYESLRISGPTDNADDPNTSITQPPKTKVNRRLQIALVLVGIMCAALVAIVVWSLAFTQKENSDKLNHEFESLVSANNGSNDINECMNNPCARGATCRNNHGGFDCDCLPGFTGKLCQLEISECSSRPCQNGGTCVDMVNSYRCLCSVGYLGTNCQERDPCRSSPCQNGATCRNQNDTYSCSCPFGYTGRICETMSNHCLSKPCRNGAHCENTLESFRCSCSSGFQGTLCENDINECMSKPCVRGATCINNHGGFDCDCPPGFTGKLCQLEISECSSRPCQNGGTCVDMVNSYRCLCSAGYYGTNCQGNQCRSQPCQNGATCRSYANTYSCSCRTGYSGRDCESAFLQRNLYRIVGININGKYGGRVEVKHNGVWGTVCDDYWNNTDAKVFCKSLNLPHSNAVAVQSAYFGQGTGDIWLDDVLCTGSEPNIASWFLTHQPIKVASLYR